MKKSIFLLIFLLATSFSSFSQEKDTLTIGILDEVFNSDSEVLKAQLYKEISDIIGINTSIVFKDVLYNDHKADLAEENYNKFLNDNTDIIISFGVANSIMLFKKDIYEKPILVVGAINGDIVKLSDEQNTSGINNLSYLAAPFSYKTDLDIFNSLFPYKNIGIIIDDFVLNQLPIKEVFDAYFGPKDATYEFITMRNDSNIIIPSDRIDAIYLVSHMNLDSNQLDNLIETIIQHKLPSISSYGVRDVEKGILLTNQPDINFNQIFRRVALNIESIYGGINASELPLRIDYELGITINMNTANQINFPIRNSMLGIMNLIEGSNRIPVEHSYSMLDLMNGVLERNLTLATKRKDINLVEQDIKNAKSQFLPDFQAGVNGVLLDPKIAKISNGQNPQFTTAGNLNLNQVVYSEDAKANVDIQNSLLAAQIENFNTDELDALLNASTSYFNALILKINVNIQNRNLQLTKQNLEIAKQNFEYGASGKSDVLRFKSQLAQNAQSMIGARNSLDQAYYQINQLLNRSISEKIEIMDTVITDNFIHGEAYIGLLETLDNPEQQYRLTEFLINEAIKNAPELKNINYNFDVIDRTYKLNDKGRYVPTVALQGQYNYTFSKSGFGSETPEGIPVAPAGNYNVGLNLSLPIFQQNKRNIQRQTSRIQKEQLTFQKENVELNIEKTINDIVLDLINEMANIEISGINEGFSKESLELSQNEYRNGAIPVIQLIDAQNNYLQAQLANATAKYNYYIVSMQLQRAFGYFFLMNSDLNNQDFYQRASLYILNNN